ncbi:MAG: mechanosensitive ion channel [Anaerolineales bacterium]
MTFGAAWQNLEEMINGWIAAVPNLIIGAVIFMLMYLLSKFVRRLVLRVVTRAMLPPTAQLVFGRLSQWSIIFLGMLVSLLVMFPSFNAGQLINLLGIGGVAIGFAFRDIVQNFLAGILILLTQPFRINDQIIVDDYEGTVEDIQTRATFIRTYDGRRVVIPNSDLFTRSVTVNTAFPVRRSQADIGIGYGDDIERARRVMLDAVSQIDAILSKPAPDVLVASLADSAVILRLRWWTESRRGDVVEVGNRVLETVKADLSAAGIDMPFPTQQILFHDQTEETDGDRSRQREGWPAASDSNPAPSRLGQAIASLSPSAGA